MHGSPFAATILDMRTSSPLELSSKVSPFFWALMAACFSDILTAQFTFLFFLFHSTQFRGYFVWSFEGWNLGGVWDCLMWVAISLQGLEGTETSIATRTATHDHQQLFLQALHQSLSLNTLNPFPTYGRKRYLPPNPTHKRTIFPLGSCHRVRIRIVSNLRCRKA